jgi:hypothetical protein
MASDSSVHECDVAWIQQNRIGVIFVAAPQGQDVRGGRQG